MKAAHALITQVDRLLAVYNGSYDEGMDGESIRRYLAKVSPEIDALQEARDEAVDEMYSLPREMAHEKCLEGERDE